MELTEKLKKEIDEMDYASMLSQWRFASICVPIFQGESGNYFSKVMAEKRKTTDHVKVSKTIGWEE